MPPKKITRDLLNDDIPIRRSIIVNEGSHNPLEDISFTPYGNSSISIRSSGNFQKTSTKITMNFQQTTMQKFLALKLRRIVFSKLRDHLKKIKEHKNQKFTLSLLNTINNRLLKTAFQEIKKYGEEKTFLRIDQAIQKIKKPHFLIFMLERVLKRLKRQTLKSIAQFSDRDIKRQLFCGKMIGIMNKFEQRHNIWEAWKKLNTEASETLVKISASKQILSFLSYISKKKHNEFFHIFFQSINSKQMENLRQQKKHLSHQTLHSSKHRSQIVSEMKDALKNAKNALQEGSILRNKQKYDYKIKIQNAKKLTKQDVTRISKQVLKVQKIQKNLLAEVEVLQGQLKHREMKKKGSNGKMKEVMKIFQKIDKEVQADQNGEIMSRKMPRFCNDIEKYLDGLDSYHLYLNQKYRQLIYEYEHKKHFSERFITEAERSIEEENLAIRDLLIVFAEKQLQDYSNRNVVTNITE